ncbi:16028_t:CDS:2, partial [Racocetra fulgida]
EHMDNPWKYVREDILFIIYHWIDVIKFLLDNSILGIRFNAPKDPHKGIDELDLSYWSNWKKEESRDPMINVEEHNDERWFFINGVMVNNHWLDENCKRLESRFNRGVKGIFNSSY